MLNFREKEMLEEASDIVDMVGRRYEKRVGTNGVERRILAMLAVVSGKLKELAWEEE
jgi:glutaredoxin 2